MIEPGMLVTRFFSGPHTVRSYGRIDVGIALKPLTQEQSWWLVLFGAETQEMHVTYLYLVLEQA